MRKLLLIFVSLLIICNSSYGLEKDKAVSIYKEKLIIANFSNESTWQDLDKGLSDDLLALFIKTKRFDIVERNKLDSVLKEQELQLTGLVNTADVVKVGQLIGARYTIFGAITSANGSHTETEQTKKLTDSSGKEYYKDYIVTKFTGQVTIDARLVDITTGEEIMAKTVTGTASEETQREKEDKSFLQSFLAAIVSGDTEEAKQKYFDQMHQKMVAEARQNAAYNLVTEFLKEFPLTGYIIGKTEDNNYLVDLGTDNGMNSKVNLKILGAPQKMKHPITGETIEIPSKKLGYLKVYDLGTSTSKTKLVRGNNDDLSPGLKVEVVDPIFVWHRALASFLIPGLGQYLEKRWLTGTLFILGEGLMAGGAYYAYYRSTDKYLGAQKFLDNADYSTGQHGDQYNQAKNQALIGMWIFIGCEAVIHIWDTINAGYAAENNNVFANNYSKGNINFVFDQNPTQKNIYLSKSIAF